MIDRRGATDSLSTSAVDDRQPDRTLILSRPRSTRPYSGMEKGRRGCQEAPLIDIRKDFLFRLISALQQTSKAQESTAAPYQPFLADRLYVLFSFSPPLCSVNRRCGPWDCDRMEFWPQPHNKLASCHE
jgi:hypothetical protein